MSDQPLSRRRFLVGAGGAAAIAATGGIVLAHPWSHEAHNRSAEHGSPPVAKHTTLDSGTGILVLVTMYGGNDGLNTVIPATDSAYQAARPTIGYHPSETLALADELSLNPKLPQLHGLWTAGNLAIVRGVSYPNPSLSHFQSMDIWQTADPSGSTNLGWLGRWLDTQPHDPLRAISVGQTLPIALRGAKQTASVIASLSVKLPPPKTLKPVLTQIASPSNNDQGLLSAIRESNTDLLAVQHDLAAIQPAQSSATANNVTASPKRFGTLRDNLATVAQLINAGIPTRVYEVSLAPFDTHSGERAGQENLLGELDDGIGAFFQALGSSPRRSDVVLATYSEFGRRVAQNASEGTDHGTSAPLFVIGTSVAGKAFYGDQPSVTDLDENGNLKVTTDFRSVYATLLEKVLGADPKPVLNGSFPSLGFI